SLYTVYLIVYGEAQPSRASHASVIVKHDELLIMTEVPQQVARQFVGDCIGNDYATHSDLLRSNAKHHCCPRFTRGTVRDVGRDGQASHINVSLLILGREGQLTENS